MNDFCSIKHRLAQYYRFVLMGEFSRDTLIKIISLDIFNMKTICELSGIPYQTFRNSKSVDFVNMSDDRVEKLLKTIYSIVKFY